MLRAAGLAVEGSVEWPELARGAGGVLGTFLPKEGSGSLFDGGKIKRKHIFILVLV